MHLTRFIRQRTDVELERLARPGTKWDWTLGWRWFNESYDIEPGCMLCNAFDCRSDGDYQRAKLEHPQAERAYMDLAGQYGDDRTGRMVARLARREMRRRSLEAADRLLSEMQPSPVELRHLTAIARFTDPEEPGE